VFKGNKYQKICDAGWIFSFVICLYCLYLYLIRGDVEALDIGVLFTLMIIAFSICRKFVFKELEKS
jgi:hypothetical protein